MTGFSKIAAALGLSAVLALGGLAADPAPAKADGGLVAGLIIGGVAGHVITRHHYDRHYHGQHYYYGRPHYHVYKHRHVYRYDAADAHRRWCHHRYRSYDPYSNTWVAYSGHVRQCRSPYWR